MAFTKPREPPAGKVTVAVEVEDWSVPVKGAALMIWSDPVSEKMINFGTVPGGMY